jgi:hypothetical protein
MALEVKINGVTYSNVGTLEPFVEIDYNYSVKTLDGQLHQSVKGKKTHYNIVFYNAVDGVFYDLMNLFSSGEKVMLTTPKNATEEYTAEYFPEIKGYNIKGRLSNGQIYHNGLNVEFQKVAYD